MEERFAIITGSTKGIGKEIGCLLLKNNFRVIFNYADDIATANQLHNELSNDYKGQFYIIRQRLETESDVEVFCEKCRAITKHLEILILNAGCTDRTPWDKMTWKQWQRVMDINLNAPAAIVRNLNTNIVSGGNIIFIGSILGLYAHAASIPYSVSKAGVHSLTKALVKEYCERKIRVNAVLPGFVETSWQKDKSIEQKERICKKISLHRFATVGEIAETVFWIINSSYVNGSLIEVDGGYCYE